MVEADLCRYRSRGIGYFFVYRSEKCLYKEAAEELGVSVNTVKTLLKQGMRELRELLKDKQELIFYFYLLRAECREQNPIYDHL